MQFTDIGTKNVRKDVLNTILGYAMAGLENLWNTCERGVAEYTRV